MKRRYQTTLLAAAVASLLALPAWSTEPSQQEPLGTGEPVQGVQSEPDFKPSGVTDPALEPGAEESLEMGQEDPQTGTDLQMGQDDPQMASGDNPVYELTPNELKSLTVVNPLGEKVGNVKSVVHSKASGDIQAVISSGGILGIGATEVAVPLDELELSADKLLIGATAEDLKARGHYESEAFIELEPGNRPISEFSAFELVPEGEPAPEEPMSQSEDTLPAPSGDALDPAPEQQPLESEPQY